MNELDNVIGWPGKCCLITDTELLERIHGAGIAHVSLDDWNKLQRAIAEALDPYEYEGEQASKETETFA